MYNSFRVARLLSHESLWKEWTSFTIEDVRRVLPRNFVHCFQRRFHIRLGYETLSFLDAIASSSVYPCEWVSQSVSGSYFRTSVASRLASLFFICLFVLSIFLFLDNWYTSEQIWFQHMIKFRIFGITLFFFRSTSKARKIFGITFNFF